MSRSLALFLAVLTVASLAAPQAHAKDFRAKYEDANLSLLTDFFIRSKAMTLENNEQTMDYLRLTECDIFKSVKDSQFKQQAIQGAIQRKINQPIPGEGILYLKVPTLFYVTDYNFDTQSLTLAPASVMKRANIFDLIGASQPVCDNADSAKLSLPGLYSIRLSNPISFYRIPLKKELAEIVLNKMDRVEDGSNYKVIYGLMYIQVEPVPPTIQTVYGSRKALARGQLDVIDLFLDQNHKVLLRQLDFGENF